MFLALLCPIKIRKWREWVGAEDEKIIRKCRISKEWEIKDEYRCINKLRFIYVEDVTSLSYLYVLYFIECMNHASCYPVHYIRRSLILHDVGCRFVYKDAIFGASWTLHIWFRWNNLGTCIDLEDLFTHIVVRKMDPGIYTKRNIDAVNQLYDLPY